jgi:hypothetical protein
MPLPAPDRQCVKEPGNRSPESVDFRQEHLESSGTADFNPRGALAALGKAEALRGLKPAVQAATLSRRIVSNPLTRAPRPSGSRSDRAVA